MGNAAKTTIAAVIVQIGGHAPKTFHSKNSGRHSEAAAAVRNCVPCDLRGSFIILPHATPCSLGWGVVIAIYQQLHEYQQFEKFIFNNPTDTGCREYFADDEANGNLGMIFQSFFMQYYLNATYFKDSDDTFGFTFGSRNWATPEYVPYRVVSDEKRSSCSTPSAGSMTMFCDGAGYASTLIFLPVSG